MKNIIFYTRNDIPKGQLNKVIYYFTNHCSFLICFLLLFEACFQSNTTEATPNPTSFFDLETYFHKEVQRLKNTKSIQKAVSIGTETEQKTIDNVNFSQELAVFTQSNINKSSLLEKYEVDSIFNAQEQLQQITYKAKNAALRTQHLAVFFHQNEVSKVEILNTSQNLIAQSEQKLRYSPDEGYSIQSQQKIVFSEPENMTVRVKF